MFGQGDECESCDQGGDLEGGRGTVEGLLQVPFALISAGSEQDCRDSCDPKRGAPAKESCLTQLSASLVRAHSAKLSAFAAYSPLILSGTGGQLRIADWGSADLVRGIDPVPRRTGLIRATCTSCRVW